MWKLQIITKGAKIMFNVKRKPTHPGEILKIEFMEPLGLTQSQIAKELNTTFRTVNELVNEKRNVSPEMAVKLARYFGTSEELWLNLQNQHDLYQIKAKRMKILRCIKPYSKLHKQAV
jgi:addiction module HigA family antidote